METFGDGNCALPLVHENSPPPEGIGLKSTLHGVTYQLGLLLLIFKRAMDKELKFKQATEWDKMGKFDDAVIAFRDPPPAESKIIIHAFQAKHKHKQDDHSMITDKDLLNMADGDFSLFKYFLSFLKIKKEKKEYECIGDLVIYTNADIKLNTQAKELNLENLLVKAQVENPFIQIKPGSNGKQYKFDLRKKEELKPLYQLLSQASEIAQLATCLAEYVYEEKKFELRASILKKFHVALAKQVFDVNSKCFKADFIKGKTDNDALTELLNLFKVKLKKYKKTDFKTIWKSLKKREATFSFSKDFGKIGKEKKYPQHNITNDTITEAEIKEFLRHLVLAVNQPNEMELYDALQVEIGVDFNVMNSEFIASLFQKEMLDWLKLKKGTFLTEEDGKEMFEKAKSLLSNMALMGHTLEYKAQVKNSNIVFKEDFPIQALLKKKEQVHFINCPQGTWLTGIKLFTSIKTIKKFQADDSCIFLKVKSALNLGKLLEEAFSKSEVLVIEINKKLSDSIIINLINQLSQMIKKSADKKILLLTQKNAQSIREKIEIASEVHESGGGDFSALTKESQKHLLSKPINISGKKKKISEWFSGKVDWIDSSVLEGLVASLDKKPVEINFPKIVMSPFDLECYVDRVFERRVTLNKLTLAECPDLILLSSKKISSKRSPDKAPSSGFTKVGDFLKKYSKLKKQLEATKDADTRKKVEAQSKKLIAEKNRLYLESDNELNVRIYQLREIFKNVHIIEQGSKRRLIWKKSYGSIQGIRDCMKKRATVSPEEKEFSDISEHKIIAAEPGMGKSMVIQHMLLADQNQAEKDDFKNLVLNINLNESKNYINKQNFSEKSCVPQFLVELFNLPFLGFHYLVHQLERKALKLYLDGFDEINAIQQEKICQFLTHLQADFPGNKVVVATRHHKSKQLEDVLLTVAYSLRQVQPKEQKDYLKNYWSQQLSKEHPNAREDRIKNFARFIIEKFAKDLNDTDNEFMGIPLQLRLIAEALQDDCRAFLLSNKSKPDARLIYDKIALYEKIISKKLQIYFDEKLFLDRDFKIGLKSSMEEAIIEKHCEIAFQLLFPDSTFTKSVFSTRYFSASELNGIGLVEESGGEFNFVHRTYAEYLAARKILSLLATDKSIKKNTGFIEFMLTHIFTDRARESILKFISAMLQKPDYHQSLGNWEYIVSLSLLPQDIMSPTDKSKDAKISIDYAEKNIRHEEEEDSSSDEGDQKSDGRSNAKPIGSKDINEFFEDLSAQSINSKIVDLANTYEANNLFLNEKQVDSLLKVYEHYKRAAFYSYFYSQLLFSLNPDNEGLICKVKYQLVCEDDYELLKKLSKKYPSISHTIEDLGKFLKEKLTKARVLYLEYSANTFNLQQLQLIERQKKQFKDAGSCQKHFLRLFAKLPQGDNALELAFVRRFALDEKLLSLFEILNERVPNFRLLSSDVHELFSEKSFTWLETTGIEFLYKLKAINYEVVDILTRKINETKIDGGHFIYANKIVCYYINKLLNSNSLDLANFNLYTYLSLAHKFFISKLASGKHYASHDNYFNYKPKKMDVLFDLFSRAFSKQTIHKEVVEYLALLLKGIATQAGLQIFQFDQGLLIVDPKGDYRFTMPLKAYDLFIDCIKTGFSSDEAISAEGYRRMIRRDEREYEYQKCEAQLRLTMMLSQGEARGKEARQKRAALILLGMFRACKLKLERRKFLYSPAVMQEMMGGGDLARSTAYLAALQTNRLHDAMQIYRGKPQRPIIWSPDKREYTFFKPAAGAADSKSSQVKEASHMQLKY